MQLYTMNSLLGMQQASIIKMHGYIGLTVQLRGLHWYGASASMKTLSKFYAQGLYHRRCRRGMRRQGHANMSGYASDKLRVVQTLGCAQRSVHMRQPHAYMHLQLCDSSIRPRHLPPASPHTVHGDPDRKSVV